MCTFLGLMRMRKDNFILRFKSEKIVYIVHKQCPNGIKASVKCLVV